MCGRYALKLLPEHLQEIYRITGRLPSFPARYNIAPTQEAPVIGFNPKTGERGVAEMRWGLIPHWAQDASIGPKLINARSETVADKPSFRDSFRKKRCIVPASGFYEWHREGKTKQPYYFQTADEKPMGFAGLWAEWKYDGETVRSYTILTTEANSTLQGIHDRMPVMLHPDSYGVWLDPQQPEPVLQDLLKPYNGSMKKHPVSTAINKPTGQGEELIAKLDANSA